MLFKISYGPSAEQSYTRNSLIEAAKVVEKLVRQGFDVVLSNAETGFVISEHKGN